MPSISQLQTSINSAVTSKTLPASISPGDVGNSLAAIAPSAVTKAELDALISGNNLQQGKAYLITDFRTKYTQPITGTLKTSGVTEPLIVFAATVNTLHARAISTLYPSDVIEYSATDSNGSDRGVITFRADTQGNETPYDFRHVTFARWHVDTSGWPTFTVGQPYTKGTYGLGSGGSLAIMLQDTVSFNLSTDELQYITFDPSNFWIENDYNLEGQVATPGLIRNAATLTEFHTFSDNTGALDLSKFKNCVIKKSDFNLPGVDYCNVVLISNTGNLQNIEIRMTTQVTMNLNVGNNIKITSPYAGNSKAIILGNNVDNLSIDNSSFLVMVGSSVSFVEIDGFYDAIMAVQLQTSKFSGAYEIWWNMQCRNIRNVYNWPIKNSDAFRDKDYPTHSAYFKSDPYLIVDTNSTAVPRFWYIDDAGALVVENSL